MSIYSIPPLIGGITVLLLSSFVVLKNRKSIVNKTFFIFSITVGVWLLSYAIAYSTRIEEKAILCTKFACTAVIFTSSTCYHFIVSLLDLKRERKYVYLAYFVTFVLFIYFIKTSLFLKGVYKYYWGYYSKAGPLHPLYLIIYYIIFGRAMFLLFNTLKNKTKLLPRYNVNQIKYVIWSFFIAVLGNIDYIPKYGVEFYPFGFVFIIAFVFVVAYAIVRHQLMEIEVIIKKTVVFAGMFTFAFGVFVAIALLVSQFIAGGNTLLAFAISAFLITLLLRPIETFLINSTDKFLFQKKYEYKQILRAFIDEVITVLNLDEVINSTLELLDKTLHPYTSSIFILNKVEDKYQLYNCHGLENKNITFTSDSKLITFLKRFHSPAVIKQVNGITGVSQEIQQEMLQLKADLCLPLLLHNDLVGFISLGKKKSDEEYTKDDLDVLLDLARTESIAIGNAQLLQEAAQSERRAAIGTMAAGIHHEIGNPLNIINTKIQLFLLGSQRGLYKDKPKEEVLKECDYILNETLKQTNRISEITRKLANFAKPSKEFKPELVTIPEEIDEALAVMGHELELERIKIERQISSDLPKILADRREIQQIFFNLIRNAAQAIEETGIITIKGVSRADNKIHIEIQDTGKGIPEDKIHRIFEPFFTTKGPNKGTGLGLSIVRQLVWRNKGEISFRSQVGVGTTFILEFPQSNQTNKGDNTNGK